MQHSWHSCAGDSSGLMDPLDAGAVANSLREDSQPLPLNFQMEHPWGTDFIQCGCGARFAFVFDVDVAPRVRVTVCDECECVHYQTKPNRRRREAAGEYAWRCQRRGGAMQRQLTLPGVRLRMTAAERKEVIHERLRWYPARQAAREARRRKDVERRRRLRERTAGKEVVAGGASKRFPGFDVQVNGSTVGGSMACG